MIKLLTKYKIHLLFIVFGTITGYAYWYYVGCQSGTCPLKSVWYYNAGIGGFGGYVLADFIVDLKKKKAKKQEKTTSKP